MGTLRSTKGVLPKHS